MSILRILVLIGLLAGVSGLSGCLVIDANDNCRCKRERDKFADQVATKVVEKQQDNGRGEEIKKL